MSKGIVCPICEKATEISASNSYRPFCSNRCRLIDLGQWVNESYSISDTNPTTDNIDFASIEKIKH